ncbi:MAG: Maf family protein [Candidatus Paceibacterota bacterium]|jgi:septum formation protein
MKIILGSSSKPRKKVLQDNGYQFEVMSPDIDEKGIRSDDLYQLPLMIARAKADALIPNITEPTLLITADQVVVCHGSLHEKPQSEAEVRAFLQKYSDEYPAETVSALVVTNTGNGKQADGVDIAKIYFNPIPLAVIDDFIKTEDLFSRAGGFVVESPLFQPFIKKIEGSIDSVMGMPITLLERLITEVEL